MSFDFKIKDGDLSIKNGDLEQIDGGNKLVQDILKMVLTEAGGNPSFPWYGSYVSKTLIGNVLDQDITFQMAKSQLQNALNTLKEMQQIQVQSGQKVSADEQIAQIVDISINENTVDPRFFDVRIKVLSKGMKPITTAFTVSTI